MIENVMLLLKGSLSGRDINELMAQCHPLGMFKDSVMRSIPTFESTPRGYCRSLPNGSRRHSRRSLLCSVPARECHDMEARLVMCWRKSRLKLSSRLSSSSGLKTLPTTSTSSEEKLPPSWDELLNVRADTNAINITLNSFGTPLNEPAMRVSDRKRLYPAVGYLYPAGTAMLADVADEDELGRVLELFPQYGAIWNIHAAGSGEKSIDDAFYERDVQMNELAFEGQMHFAVFYAYVKLKEQEIRNLVWISECILQAQKDEINKFVPVFSQHAPWRQSKRR